MDIARDLGFRWHRGYFDVNGSLANSDGMLPDTYLNVGNYGWAKGVAFVNGFNLVLLLALILLAPCSTCTTIKVLARVIHAAQKPLGCTCASSPALLKATQSLHHIFGGQRHPKVRIRWKTAVEAGWPVSEALGGVGLLLAGEGPCQHHVCARAHPQGLQQ